MIKERYCSHEVARLLKESEDEKMRKSIIYALRNGGFYNNDKTDEALAWLEKQGEQKSINDLTQQEAMNIADTKFKIGDWIVYNRNDHSRKIMQIYDIRDNRYYFNDNIHFSWSVKECDEKSHLWTIEDAKEGDVLVASDGSIFIYKNQRDNGVVHYVAVTPCNDLVINENDYSWERKNACHPATKDEQIILFARMKEAGYEWDEETKELKKIEQTTEIPFDAKDSELQEATYYIPDGYHAEINGNAVVIKKGELINDTPSQDHWQDVRERAAIAALQGLLSAPLIEDFNLNSSVKEITDLSVILTNALVKKLKGE